MSAVDTHKASNLNTRALAAASRWRSLTCHIHHSRQQQSTYCVRHCMSWQKKVLHELVLPLLRHSRVRPGLEKLKLKSLLRCRGSCKGWSERKLWLLRSADRRVAVRLRQERNELLDAKVQWCLLQLLLTEERQHLHVKGRQLPMRKWMNSIELNGERGGGRRGRNGRGGA